MTHVESQPCKWWVYRFGAPFAQVINADADVIEQWVKKLAWLSGAWIDWHYFGGRAIVRYVGLPNTRERLRVLVGYLQPELEQAGGTVYFV